MSESQERAVWVCGAADDATVPDLSARLAALGLAVVPVPETADRAVALLSPALAAGDPSDLRDWITERGPAATLLIVTSGSVDWDDDRERFAAVADAVPASVRDGFRSKPLLLDLRGADDAKVDRCARLVTGAVNSELPAGHRRRRRGCLLSVLVAVLAFLAVSSVVLLSVGGGDSGTSTSTSTPSTTVPSSGESSSGNVGLVVAVVLAAGLVGTGVWLLGKRAGARERRAPAPPPAPGTPATNQVFVSHDMQADRKVAQRLVERLQQRQIRTWTAEGNIRPGEQWVFAIERGLTSSRGAVVLLSPDALASNWVKQEIQMIINLAVDGKLHVIPVLLGNVDVPLVLRGYQLVAVDDFDLACDEFQRLFAAT